MTIQDPLSIDDNPEATNVARTTEDTSNTLPKSPDGDMELGGEQQDAAAKPPNNIDNIEASNDNEHRLSLNWAQVAIFLLVFLLLMGAVIAFLAFDAERVAYGLGIAMFVVIGGSRFIGVMPVFY